MGIGFEGNETADRYAKRGTNLEIDEEDEPILPVSPQVIEKLIENWAEKKHMKRWQSRTKHILKPMNIVIQRYSLKNLMPRSGKP